jgi:translation initiation factor 1
VTGFEGDVKDIESLGKELKALCGTGGAVKEGKIIIQGDHREKVIQWLIKKGYKDTKRSGG